MWQKGTNISEEFGKIILRMEQSYTLKTEEAGTKVSVESVIGSSEMLVSLYEYIGVMSQKTVIFIFASLRTLDFMKLRIFKNGISSLLFKQE
jgi:hypothetical protein